MSFQKTPADVPRHLKWIQSKLPRPIFVRMIDCEVVSNLQQAVPNFQLSPPSMAKITEVKHSFKILIVIFPLDLQVVETLWKTAAHLKQPCSSRCRRASIHYPSDILIQSCERKLCTCTAHNYPLTAMPWQHFLQEAMCQNIREVLLL